MSGCVLQYAATSKTVYGRVLEYPAISDFVWPCRVRYCCVLQCLPMSGRVVQCLAASYSIPQCLSILQYRTVSSKVQHCPTVSYNVLQCCSTAMLCLTVSRNALHCSNGIINYLQYPTVFLPYPGMPYALRCPVVFLPYPTVFFSIPPIGEEIDRHRSRGG